MLNEKRVQYFPVVENFWERREKFIKLNPMGTVPFLASKPSTLVSGSGVIVEYLEEKFPDITLIFGNPERRSEIRKMCTWFDEKFFNEVVKHIIYERIFNYFKTKATPDIAFIKIARTNLIYHMDYITFILSKKGKIGDEAFSLADITAAAHISSLDYLGEINWKQYPVIRDWYAVIKSRPSFRDILYDTIPGFKPSTWYRDLDF